MKVYPVGTKVMIDGYVEGVVVVVTIRGGESVNYTVEWWNGRDIACRELDDFRVTPIDREARQVSIGF